MSKSILACAGALLLSTTCLTIAQQAASTGVTIVPQGQSAPAVQTAQAPSAPAPAAPAPAAPEAALAAEAPAAAPAAAADPAAAEAAAPTEAQAAAAPAGAAPALDAQPSADSAANGAAGQPTGTNGMFVDVAGSPTYNVSADGTADWFAWRGFKKYGANCLSCHGPDGLGSSFAPNLTESLQKLDYYEFAGIIVSGQQNVWHPQNSIMPAWGEDPNVMCSMDAIYVYLRGRADGPLGRGEPKRPEPNREAQEAEYACLGQ